MPESVFLCHSGADKDAVETLATKLRVEGFDVWLDTWNLVPGERFTPRILEALKRCSVIAVFLGPLGRGPWQNEEVDNAINTRARDGVRIIPVLLPGATEDVAEGLLENRTWVKFESLEDQDACRRLIAGIRGVPPGPAVMVLSKARIDGCPYRGLAAFGVNDWELFFGREKLAQRALEAIDALLRDAGAVRCLSIVGASGTGKSSFARAGIVHSLNIKYPAWTTISMEPGRQPHETLADRLLKLTRITVSGAELSEEAEGYLKDNRRLHRSVLGALGSDVGKGRLVLLVDQFEEVFTQCENKAVRDAFINNLLCAASELDGKLLLLLCVRADFYENCLKIPELRDVLPTQIPVGPMGRDELRAAIRNPALKAGCDVEAGLIQLLLDDCDEQPSPLPLLQMALQKLWEKRSPDGILTAASYESMSLEKAIDEHSEAVFQTLTAEQQQACLRLLMQLVEPLDDRRYTRRRLAADALMPHATDPASIKAVREVEAVIGLLSGQRTRLITIRPEGKTAEIEIAHEAIFRGWKRLADLLDKNSEFLLWKKRLDVGIADYRRSADPSCYLTGLLLDRAIQWLKERPADHTPEERDYVRASVARRWYKRLGVAAALVSVFIVIAGGSSWYNRKLGLERTMDDAQKLSRDKSPVAVLLSYEVTKHDTGRRAAELLQEAIQAVGYPLLAHTAAFTDVSFSYDGAAVAAATEGALLLWEPRPGKSEDPLWMPERINEPKIFEFSGKPVRVALSGDRNTIGGAGDTGAIKIWTTGDRTERPSVPAFASGIAALAFADNGRHLAIALNGNAVVWWNVEGGKEEGRAQVDAPIGAAAVHPGGATVALALWDGSVRWWTPSRTEVPGDGLAHNLPTLNYVAYSEDGSHVASSEKSGSTYLWNVESRKREREFQVPGKQTRSASMSRDGKRLALWSGDDSITIWDAVSGNQLLRYSRQSPGISKIALNRTGTLLAAGESSGRIRIYELGLPDLRKRAWDMITHIQAADLRDCYRYVSKSACDEYLSAARR
jgi:WD40 repeat protein